MPDTTWFASTVGGPNPNPNAAQPQAANPFLAAAAAAEDVAETASAAAVHVAQQAMTDNVGYEAAQASVKSAAKAWRSVNDAVKVIEDTPDAQATPELTAALVAAKVAAPAIRGTAMAALGILGQLHQALTADQAEKRPDLPPAKSIDVHEDDRGIWLPLAIAAGIGYILYKAVF